MSYDTEELVSAYVRIRDERSRILREYEVKDAELKSDLEQLKVFLLSICNDVNANSIKTSQGTVMRKLNERFYCNDWDSFRKFVAEHDAIELLERRIHQGNFKQFLSSHEEDGLPPGVNVMREYDVTVRKASSSD
jgi:hypothetical protein